MLQIEQLKMKHQNYKLLFENFDTCSYLQRIIAGAFGAQTSNKIAPQWHPP
jgi:hypothetical protein